MSKASRYGFEEDIQEASLSGNTSSTKGKEVALAKVSEEAQTITLTLRETFTKMGLREFKSLLIRAVNNVLDGPKPSSNRFLDKSFFYKDVDTEGYKPFKYPMSGAPDVTVFEALLRANPYARVLSRKQVDALVEAFQNTPCTDHWAAAVEGPANFKHTGVIQGEDPVPALLTAIDNRPKVIDGRPWFDWVVIGTEEFLVEFDKNFAEAVKNSEKG